MLKKTKVVMLATDQKATMGSLVRCIKEHHATAKTYRVGNIAINTNDHLLMEKWQTQHLYIISDDKIQEGDWTFDPILGIGKIIKDKEECFYSSNLSGGSITTPWKRNLEDRLKKIIATTDRLNKYSTGMVQLPQPSQSFIEKYVEKYNTDQQITDVMVEFEEYMTEGWIPTYNNPDNHNFDKEAELDYRLKINPKDNTITIRSIKTEWNKEEIIDKLHQYWASVHEEGYQKPQIIEWFKENLF